MNRVTISRIGLHRIRKLVLTDCPRGTQSMVNQLIIECAPFVFASNKFTKEGNGNCKLCGAYLHNWADCIKHGCVCSEGHSRIRLALKSLLPYTG